MTDLRLSCKDTPPQTQACVTAATRVWLATVLLCCNHDHVQAIAAWPTDPPSCVITNANSRLRQLFSTTFDETFTLVTAFFPTRRTDLFLTTVPPHSPELGGTRHLAARSARALIRELATVFSANPAPARIQAVVDEKEAVRLPSPESDSRGDDQH